MPRAITLYVCNICEQEYETEEAAAECEKRGRDPERFAVGDVVIRQSYTFGWFDGERHWIENYDDVQVRSSVCPDGWCRRCCYRFYYVVTAIDRDPRDPHRVRYHLVTKAMKERNGYQSGWTFNEGHYTPIKVPRPPAAVVSSIRHLVGQLASDLLR